jgi:hypothetical protein
MYKVGGIDNMRQQPGQGDAYIFSPMDFSILNDAIAAKFRDKQLKAAAKAQEDEKKQKEQYELFKYQGPKILDQHYVPTIQNQTNDYLKAVADASGKPGGINDEDRKNFALMKNKIEYSSQKLNGLKKRIDEDVTSINQFPDYFDKEKLKMDRIKSFHPDADEKGNVDISTVDPDSPVGGGNLAKYIKQPELYKAVTDDLKIQVEAGQSRLGDDIQGKETGSLFWKKDANGKRVPGVSEETIDFYSQHPDVSLTAEATVGEKIQKDADRLKGMGDARPIEAIMQDLSQDKDILIRDHIKKQLESVNGISVKKSLRSASGGGGAVEENTAEGVFIKTLAGLQQQTPEFISGLSESNEVNANKVPYLDATSLFQGIKTGEGKDGKAFEPYQVFIDPEKPGTIFIRQTRNDKLTPMSDAAITQFAVSVGNIKGNNLNYKKMMEEGGKLGVFGQNNKFNGSKAAKADPEFNQEQEELSQAVAAEAINRGDKFKQAIGTNKGSTITNFFGGEGEANIGKAQSDINENVFKDALLVVGEAVYKNPKVTSIDAGLFGGVEYTITDSNNNEIKLSEEDLSAIAEGNSNAGKLVVGRKTVKGKPVADKTDPEKPGAFD